MSVTYRNTGRSALIITTNINGNTSLVKFGPNGSRIGDDLVELTADQESCMDIRKAIARGKIEKVDAEAALEALATHDAAQKERREKADEALREQTSKLYRPQDRDIMGQECMGPGASVNTKCPVPVLIPSTEADIEPPLCSSHKDLADQYHQVMQEKTIADVNGERVERTMVWQKK